MLYARKAMEKITFSTFDPFVHDAPIFCEICTALPPIFIYALLEPEDDKETKGYCCGPCAAGFLRRLENLESREWEAEEAALEDADILDDVELVG
jgi:hypothetical protein